MDDSVIMITSGSGTVGEGGVHHMIHQYRKLSYKKHFAFQKQVKPSNAK